MTRRPQIRKGAAGRLVEAEPPDDVLGGDRIREVLAVVEDAGEPRPGEEVLAEHLVPEALDGLELREEAVAPEVEAVAVELDRLRQAADRSVGFEDGSGLSEASEHVRGGQAGG